MKKDLFKIISISLLFLIFGGVSAFTSLWQNVFEVFKMFFPIFFDVAKMELEDYLTSPYFITGAIMAVASAFGIWFGKKNSKTLFLVVSIISELVSLVSILVNLIVRR